MCLFPPSLGSSLIIHYFVFGQDWSWLLFWTLSSSDEDLHFLTAPKMHNFALVLRILNASLCFASESFLGQSAFEAPKLRFAVQVKLSVN